MLNNSHDKISHSDFGWFGYDWGSVGNPKCSSSHPLQVYLPESVDDLPPILATIGPGNSFIIRANGHSNNNLVTSADVQIPVICTQKMTAIRSADDGTVVQSDGVSSFVEVEAGCDVGTLEGALNKEGFALPVVPDHHDITVGGLASVGGISAASHKYGLFVDNILEMKIVDQHGVQSSIPAADILAYLGKAGSGGFVIGELKLRVIELNKKTSLLERVYLNIAGRPTTNDAKMYAETLAELDNSQLQDYEYCRGMWLNVPMQGGSGFGVITGFKPDADQNNWPAHWVERESGNRELEAMGKLAGNLPPEIAQLETQLKMMAWLRLTQKLPRFQTYEDVEFFTDMVVDSSVGTPTYMLTIFLPSSRFKEAFLKFRNFCDGQTGELSNDKGFALYALYSRVIESQFLCGQQGSAPRYIDISLYVGMNVNADGSTNDKAIQAAVDELNDIAEDINSDGEALAFRYMCTLTGDVCRPGSGDARDPASHW